MDGRQLNELMCGMQFTAAMCNALVFERWHPVTANWVPCTLLNPAQADTHVNVFTCTKTKCIALSELLEQIVPAWAVQSAHHWRQQALPPTAVMEPAPPFAQGILGWHLRESTECGFLVVPMLVTTDPMCVVCIVVPISEYAIRFKALAAAGSNTVNNHAHHHHNPATAAGDDPCAPERPSSSAGEKRGEITFFPRLLPMNCLDILRSLPLQSWAAVFGVSAERPHETLAQALLLPPSCSNVLLLAVLTCQVLAERARLLLFPPASSLLLLRDDDADNQSSGSSSVLRLWIETNAAACLTCNTTAVAPGEAPVVYSSDAPNLFAQVIAPTQTIQSCGLTVEPLLLHEYLQEKPTPVIAAPSQSAIPAFVSSEQ